MLYGLVCLFIFLLVGCTANETSTNKTIANGENNSVTILSNFPSETLDPHLNYTPVKAGITETLVKINEELKLEPWIAEQWKSDDNGKTWTFIIRSNVTFHNGKEVDAQAVKASLERNIQVSESMKNALKIKEIEAKEQTLTITLEQPLPQFPSELVHPNTAIIDAPGTF